MPVQVARAFADARLRREQELKRQQRWEQSRGSAQAGEREAFEEGQDDCKKAFRRCPVEHVMVVCVYNPVNRRAEFIILPCFIFGCYAAVHGWNRYSHFVTHCGRRLALVATTGYYDDFQIYGPPWYCRHAQRALGKLLGPLIGFDPAKHQAADQKPRSRLVSAAISLECRSTAPYGWRSPRSARTSSLEPSNPCSMGDRESLTRSQENSMARPGLSSAQGSGGFTSQSCSLSTTSSAACPSCQVATCMRV